MWETIRIILISLYMVNLITIAMQMRLPQFMRVSSPPSDQMLYMQVGITMVILAYLVYGGI